MKRISILKNTIQEYAWGSYAAIPELLDKENLSNRPQAELWMGAHPKASSMVKCNGEWKSLLKLIEKNPIDVLGKAVAKRFENRLPYLFKILAAAKPLSIQAHPSIYQSIEGFERENRLGIPLNAPNRNYKDDNHKPECICALTVFWALNGFRKISEILSRMEKVCPSGLEEELDLLRKNQNSQGLKDFFHALMTMGQTRKAHITGTAVKHAEKYADIDQAFQWMINLHTEYPADIGIFSPLFLNLIHLKPGQAMFLPAGELHAYLDGVGIELMANSDNVLRGGLTPKHVDVQELLNVLNFKERHVNILSAEQVSDCERQYPTPVEEFALSVIDVKAGMICKGSIRRSIEIVLCTQGKAVVTEFGKDNSIHMDKGTSIVIPASVEMYSIEGDATLFKASVPVQ